jgi:ferredoxin
MQMKNIDFYYFSGTGNTLVVIKKMKEVFENDDVEVNLFPLEKTDPSNVNLDHVIGLGFPVAEQGTYPFVWAFIKSLPPAKGTGIFMVDTLVAFSGGVVGPLKRIVMAKGYRPLGAREIRMPNNLFPKKIVPEKVERKVRRGLDRAEQYANDILAGRSRWRRVPLLSDAMALFSQHEATFKIVKRLYPLKIDPAKCIACGLCVRLCPVNNIEMGEYPAFRGRCLICMRCVSFCPTEAIYMSRKKHARYRAVKATELLPDE